MATEVQTWPLWKCLSYIEKRSCSNSRILACNALIKVLPSCFLRDTAIKFSGRLSFLMPLRWCII